MKAREWKSEKVEKFRKRKSWPLFSRLFHFSGPVIRRGSGRGKERDNGSAPSGFTIIEFVIYIALVGAVLVAVTGFAFEFVAAQAKAQALQEVNRNARLAISRIGLEVREATDLNAGDSTFGSHPGVLSLETGSVATDPTIFCVTAGVLRVSQGDAACDASDPALTSDLVTVSSFTVDNASTSGRSKFVRVSVTVEYTNPSAISEFSATTTLQTTAILHKNDGYSN